MPQGEWASGGGVWPSVRRAAPAMALDAGMARVTGGDRLVVAGKRCLLHGVDAPESNQPCYVDDKL